MTLRSQRGERSERVAPTRSSGGRPRAAALGLVVGAVGVLGVTAAVLGSAPAAVAAPTAPVRVVPITVSQAQAIAPLCPTAWSITADDDRLGPISVSRNVAVATCLQLFRLETRLVKGARKPPDEGTAVPSLPGGRSVPPIRVQLVRDGSGASTGPSTVTIRVPVPAASAPATGSTSAGSSAGGSSSGGSSAGGSSSGGSSSGNGWSGGDSSGSTAGVPIGDGGASAATDPGTTLAPSVAPAPAAAAPGPLLTDPGAAGTAAPAPVTGGSGTVSDPTTKTAATTTPGGTGEVLPLLLVLATIVVATVLGVGVRYAVVHDRLPTMPWARRRGPEHPADPGVDPGAGPGPDDGLSAAGFVDRWTSRAGAGDLAHSEALTDPRPGSLLGPAVPSGPPVSLEKAGQHRPDDLGAGRPEREVEDMVGVGHHQ